MTIIHCEGHEFTEYVTKVEPGIVVDKWWRCDHCQLRVTRESAVKQLTGKTC